MGPETHTLSHSCPGRQAQRMSLAQAAHAFSPPCPPMFARGGGLVGRQFPQQTLLPRQER